MRPLPLGIARLAATALLAVSALSVRAEDAPQPTPAGQSSQSQPQARPYKPAMAAPGVGQDIIDACDAWDPVNTYYRGRSGWRGFCNHCQGCQHNCHAAWCGWCAKASYWKHCGVYPMNGYTPRDPRDTVLYSAQGYNVPMAVPVAPVVGLQYNYGWGLPSSRLTRIGAYQNYWPQQFTSQAGNPAFVGQHPPQVYWPTDTTQMGYYTLRVPHWVEGAPPQ